MSFNVLELLSELSIFHKLLCARCVRSTFVLHSFHMNRPMPPYFLVFLFFFLVCRFCFLRFLFSCFLYLARTAIIDCGILCAFDKGIRTSKRHLYNVTITTWSHTVELLLCFHWRSDKHTHTNWERERSIVFFSWERSPWSFGRFQVNINGQNHMLCVPRVCVCAAIHALAQRVRNGGG